MANDNSEEKGCSSGHGKSTKSHAGGADAGAGASCTDSLRPALVRGVRAGLDLPESLSEEQRAEASEAAIARLRSLAPADEAGNRMAALLVAMHNHVMSCHRRAMIEGQSHALRDENLKNAARLSGAFVKHAKAFEGHRERVRRDVRVTNEPTLAQWDEFAKALSDAHWGPELEELELPPVGVVEEPKTEGITTGNDGAAPTAATDDHLRADLLRQVEDALWLPSELSDEERENVIADARASFEHWARGDELEGMLAAQAVVTHHAGMVCFEWAAIEGQAFEECGQSLKNGIKLSGLYLKQVEPLERHSEMRKRDAKAREDTIREREARAAADKEFWEEALRKEREELAAEGAEEERAWPEERDDEEGVEHAGSPSWGSSPTAEAVSDEAPLATAEDELAARRRYVGSPSYAPPEPKYTARPPRRGRRPGISFMAA